MTSFTNLEDEEFENFIEKGEMLLTHSHTMTPFDAPGKQAF